MATRFYFPATASNTSGLTPSFNGSWNYTSEAARCDLVDTRGSSALAVGTQVGAWTATAGQTALDRQFISRPLAAQTISGTFSLMLMTREYATADNVDRIITGLYVVNSSGSVVATLKTLGNSGSTLEFVNNATHRTHTGANAAALTSYSCADGDRIVVEIGYSNSTSATSPEASAKWGEAGTEATLGDNATTADRVGWIEFSGNLTFQAQTSSTTPATTTPTNVAPTTLTDGSTTPATTTPTNVAPSTSASTSATTTMMTWTTVAAVGQETVTSSATTPSTFASTSVAPTTLENASAAPSTFTSTSVAPTADTSTSAAPNAHAFSSVAPSALADGSTTPSVFAWSDVSPATNASFATTPSSTTPTNIAPSTSTSTSTTPSGATYETVQATGEESGGGFTSSSATTPSTAATSTVAPSSALLGSSVPASVVYIVITPTAGGVLSVRVAIDTSSVDYARDAGNVGGDRDGLPVATRTVDYAEVDF